MSRVLLVDDDDLVRDIGAQLLLRLGHDVIATDSGAKAMAILQDKPGFDFLFTDVMMPGGMNGIELARAAARIDPGLKIILVSGNVDQALMKSEQLPPVFAVLQKPYRKQQLADLIAG